MTKWLLVIVAVLAPACSSGSAGPSTVSNAGSADDGSATCSSLTPGDQSVPLTVVAGTAPKPAGGAIVDGTYALATRTTYTTQTISASPSKERIRFSGGAYEHASASEGGTTVRKYAYSVSGTYLKETCECAETGAACPSSSSSSSTAYSVVGSDVWFFNPGGDTVSIYKPAP